MTEPILATAGTGEVVSIRPVAALLVSLVAVALIVASHSRPNVREGWSIAAALAMFAIVASMAPGVLEGRVYVTPFGEIVPGVELALRADALGMLFAVVASGLYVLTAIYSIGYMRGHDERYQTRFFAMLCASVGAALGIAFAPNLLLLLVFYEVLTIATYPLVAHDESEEARVSGYKYLAYAFSGGLAVFGGMLAVFWLTGTVTFSRGGIVELAAADPWTARGAFALLVAGFSVKAAVMPLHSWLPSAMVAPTPVSGLLHAVAVVKAGAFGVARTVIDVFGPGLVADLGMGAPLAAFAGATILIASLFALRQDNLKARLAYSTIAQLSYIVFGLSLLEPAALTGGLLHIPAHAFAKLTLFLCAGALYVQLHVKYISEMAGVGKRMPVTMGAFALASFSMAGMPLLAGFVSKWHLIWGGAEAGQLLVPAVLVTSGALNIGYFWPIVYTAFFERPDDREPKPVLDGPIGGTPVGEVRADGGSADEGDHDRDDHDHGHGHHDLPPTDGWGRPDGLLRETTLLMLVPLMSTTTLMVLFGIVPDYMFFFDLVEFIVEGATEGVSGR
ncbi:proton-conducting transporter membrane subunit [Natrialbaceae archaeon AArc-T1-2]|uniref:proton-conducting transporter transmembrane domain-containing protein n=1 Tax=Natrialbaceae archaeon AArc-T1-2 TaxID=3053904 RepID=UPI00255AC93C|nr:proton-conducting transporter membrane subunit [Natrialbaceae archaeon AArc-T1-2]WIV66203.1 proton-conducting transporter membrane subunit [Natrialbaceae archaeon AArc-T1-2]